MSTSAPNQVLKPRRNFLPGTTRRQADPMHRIYLFSAEMQAHMALSLCFSCSCRSGTCCTCAGLIQSGKVHQSEQNFLDDQQMKEVSPSFPQKVSQQTFRLGHARACAQTTNPMLQFKPGRTAYRITTRASQPCMMLAAKNAPTSHMLSSVVKSLVSCIHTFYGIAQ